MNDAPATVGLLERLGELLVELHGQHEHQRLMEPARQLLLLDRFAGADERRERVGALVRRWEETRAGLLRLREEMREGARQEDLYRFQLSEIDGLQLRDGEEDELRAERGRLQHAERIAAGLQEALGLLYEDPQSAAARLARAAALLRDVSRHEPEAAAPIEAIEGAQAYVEDVVGRARALRDRAVFDPERLEQIDDTARRHREAQAQVRRLGGRDPGPPARGGGGAGSDHTPRRDRGGHGARGDRGGGRGGRRSRRPLGSPRPWRPRSSSV